MALVPIIPDDIVAFFASDPGGLYFAIPDALRGSNARLAARLSSYLASIPAEIVAATLQDPRFQFFAPPGDDRERETRIWIAQHALMIVIPTRRLNFLKANVGALRPTPYNAPALSGVEHDFEHLVPLSAFEFDGSRLLRQEHAFTVLCTAGSPNSTYWLLNSIYENKIADRTRVRLDPFLWGLEKAFPAMFYKMWIYGRPIDWDRLAALKQPEHGRWQPGALSRRSEFTDFVWAPRDREVHFIAEEVPKLEDASSVAARYVHAVYDVPNRVISHLDGALRIYTGPELEARHRTHVRKAGKAGIRQKVFRTDAPIPREAFSAIVQAFYVWNQDIADYFASVFVSA